MTTWFKVAENPPPEKTLLMVCGDSGYSHYTKFLTLAFYDEEYRPSIAGGKKRWLDVTGTALWDYCWEPVYWALPIELPDIE